MLEKIAAQLKVSVDPFLVDKLLEHYTNLKERYYVGDYERSEQNAGKFCEIAVRVLQSTSGMQVTPITAHIGNFKDLVLSFESLPKGSCDDSVKFLIPHLLLAVYSVRNKRGVAHAGEINPNFKDASLMVCACDWIVGEFLRMHHGIHVEEAQGIVDGLIRRKIPLVYDLGERKRVLNPKLSYSDKALVLLYDIYPDSVQDSQLAKWTEHSNPTVFKKNILGTLHRDALIDWNEGKCELLPPGLKYVEDNYNSFLLEG